MRHLRSILYALVLAPAVWVLCAAGLTGDRTYLLVLAGVAYAVLLLTPISPLGPLIAGLVFLGLSAWGAIAPDSYATIWPAADGLDLSRPGYELGLLLAVPLLCTALSARRWAGHERPSLPLVGTLGGDARGAAAAPGTPVATESTAVLSTPASAFRPPAPPSASPAAPSASPVSADSADPTEAVPTQVVPAASSDEPTVVTAGPSDDAPTLVTKAAPDDEEPTVVTAAGEDEPTVATAAPDDEPTLVTAATGDEPTVFVVDSAGEATAPARSVETADEPDEPAEEPHAEQPAAEAEEVEEPATEADEVEEPAAEAEEPEEPAADAEEAGQPATEDAAEPEEPAAEAEEPAEPGQPEEDASAEQPDAEAATDREAAKAAVSAAAAAEAEDAEALPDERQEDPGDRTQVIPLRPAAETTHDLRDMVRRPGAGLGEETQVIFWRPPSEADRRRADEAQIARDRVAQERSRQAFRDLAAQERARQAFADRAAQEARMRGEQTQVIKLPGAGEPPEDQTQVLSAPPVNGTAESAADGPTPSIVGEERPDPGVDPTTRLVKPSEDTADMSDQRVGSVLDLERPADEIAEDPTRPLRIPSQRSDDSDRRGATPR